MFELCRAVVRLCASEFVRIFAAHELSTEVADPEVVRRRILFANGFDELGADDDISSSLSVVPPFGFPIES